MAIPIARRIVNIIGGKRKNFQHGAFAADALRRSCLASTDISITTYSHLGGTRKSAQYHGLKSILTDCELDRFYYGFGADIDTKCKEFVKESLDINAFADSGRLNEFKEKEMICYVAGRGTHDGRVMCGNHGVGPWLYEGLDPNQRVLMVIDACRANIWAEHAPSNVAVIGAAFTSCLSSTQRIKNGDGPVGSLIQWALDSALYLECVEGGNWTHHLMNIWERIVWKIAAPKDDKKLFLHNIDGWHTSFPLFYDKHMQHTPGEALGDETHMLEVDILRAIGCDSWEQVFELSHIEIRNEDVLPKLIDDLQNKVQSLSAYLAEAVIRYCIIKEITLKIP